MIRVLGSFINLFLKYFLCTWIILKYDRKTLGIFGIWPILVFFLFQAFWQPVLLEILVFWKNPKIRKIVKFSILLVAYKR